MKWILINSGSHTGRYNMDFDIFLSQNCPEDQAYFRIYQWEPYTISIGANQSFDEIDLDRARQDNIDVVKRPSGGRAILHAEELTYSVILPIKFGLSAHEIYNKTSIALSKGLGVFDAKLKPAEIENDQPNFRALLNQPSGSLCFASTAKSEVKFNGKKIIGSAQRKMNNSILQHGSILCGKFHSNLPYYLADQSSSEILVEELGIRATEISTITNRSVNYFELSQSIVSAFETEWDMIFDQDSTPIVSKFEKSGLLIHENV